MNLKDGEYFDGQMAYARTEDLQKENELHLRDWCKNVCILTSPVHRKMCERMKPLKCPKLEDDEKS